MAKSAAIFTALVAIAHTVSAEPRPPPDRGDGKQSHPCFPSDRDTVGGNSDESLPPCVRQTKIWEACGSDNDLESDEMQQCLCDGSYFEDSIGCGACLAYNDLISNEDFESTSSMIAGASSAYCSSGATSALDQIQDEFMATATEWSADQTLSTRRPTAVSNYFTATADQQGPGIESLVSGRTLTGEAPTSTVPLEDIPVDDGAGSLAGLGLMGNLCVVGGVALLLL
ncbi:hypothetical protein CC79DRAFT_1358617 [Sarocladium strictum]